MWGRQSYRHSDFDFEANKKDGIAIDWPIRYADISPWYDYVEPHAGISGSHEGMPQLPDGKFQPPMPLNCGEELVAGRLKKLFDGRRRIIPGRTANLTKELTGRSACQYRNACWLGCPYGAYFSTQSSTLPAAAKTGRLTLKPFAIASEVIFDKDRKRATGVRVLDAVSNQTTDYTAKVIFLCASTLNSTWLLMRSATDVWPVDSEAAPESWDTISWITISVLAHRASSREWKTSTTTAAGQRGSTSPATEICSATSAIIFAASAIRAALHATAGRGQWPSSVSAASSRTGCRCPEAGRLAQPAFGEMLPNHANMVSLDPTKKDKWGMPVIKIDCATGENERLMRKDMAHDMADTLEQAGVKDVNTYDNEYFPGMGIHEMGTARMGRDPKTSVLNSHNQVWDAPNVFVTDGSCMVSAACVNPSLTYMALTARAADFAVSELNRRNI
jgi:choline dehydrogenase-like flavoprotein